MRRFFTIVCCALFSFCVQLSQAQETVFENTKLTELVKLTENDTIWIVNAYFSPYRNGLELTMDFSESAVTTDGKWTVQWEKDGLTETINSEKMSYEYKEGVYELTLYYDKSGAGEKKYLYRVFNKQLTVGFKMNPDPFRYCYKAGGDTLWIQLVDFEDNPTDTKYEIEVSGEFLSQDKEGRKEPRGAMVKIEKWFGEKRDSSYIVFPGANGVVPAEVTVHFTYEDEERGIFLDDETDARKVYVYTSPDVKKIFGFDTLRQMQDGKVVNMEVCTGSGQDYLELNDATLNYYQYKYGASRPTPYYNSYEGFDYKDMEIRYFYADSVYTGMPESEWREVTGKKDTVSLTKKIDFKVPGFYKMMITAKNECNTAEGVKIDTLWTHLVSGETEHSYFQVYAADTAKIFCLNDTLCQNVKEPIVIVDRNIRRWYDEVPEYTLTFTPELTANIVMEVWKGGEILFSETKKGGEIFTDNTALESKGCDSTVFRIEFEDKNFYGELDIDVNRTSHCSPDGENTSFKLYMGMTPLLTTEMLKQQLVDDYGFDDKYVNLKKCDTFRYELPVAVWQQEENARGFQPDSLWLVRRQGTGPVGKYLYEYKKGNLERVLFDSTDIASYIQIKAHNVCGWDSARVDFTVYGKPTVELLRDGVAATVEEGKEDTLCMGMDYVYELKGFVPKEVDGYFSVAKGSYFLDGVETDKKPVGFRSGTKIRYEQSGENTESILLENKGMKACKQKLSLDVFLMGAPDSLLFRDSIGYCNTLTELNTEKLFKQGKSEFDRAEWRLNAGKVMTDDFPLIMGLPVDASKVDTLHYRLINARTCFREGTLLLRPQLPPVLDLQDRAQFCLPDTIHDFRKEEYVNDISEAGTGYFLEVFRDKEDAARRIYADNPDGSSSGKVYPLPENGVNRLVYALQNLRVDTAFGEGCRLTDEVELDLSVPKIVVEGVDTLNYPWEKYEFSRLWSGAVKAKVSYQDVNESTLQWTLLPDRNWTSKDIETAVYVLEKGQEKQDTLWFELSGESRCGTVLRDTLAVEIYKLNVKGYKDTICSNTSDYRLWDKVVAQNYRAETVEWKIEYGGGKLNGGRWGTDVTYTAPLTGDSVRISFKAGLDKMPDYTMEDTIILKINPAPMLSISKDTLWVCGRVVEIDKIPNVSMQNKGGSMERGDYVFDKGEMQNPAGKWSGNDYTFAGLNLDNFAGNIVQKVSYRLPGLPGCKPAFDTVTLVQPVPAKVRFKRQKEEMCAGDELLLDTIYTLEGNDRFVNYKWALTNTIDGHCEERENGWYYVASFPEDPLQGLKVATTKMYTCYTGSPATGNDLLSWTSDELPMVVHREPKFKVVHPYDTLCLAQSEIKIERSWVELQPGAYPYPEYENSIRVNGIPLYSDGFTYTLAEAGKRDTLIVTIDQGTCTKWKEKTDKIYLYHLPAMVSGNIVLENVCEGSGTEIGLGSLRFDQLAGKPVWSAVGGTVDGNPLVFTPDAGVSEGSVTVTVVAPHACPADALTVNVEVGQRPRLKVRDYKLCAMTGLPVEISAEMATERIVLDKIDWYRVGVSDDMIGTTGSNNDVLSLELRESDFSSGTPLLLRANIHCNGACSGVFDDTVTIHWQQPVEIVALPDISICQADPEGVDLIAGGEVAVKNSNGLWYWNTKTVGMGNMVGNRFMPADNDGTAFLELTAEGLANCPAETAEIAVEVLAAPAAGIVVEGSAVKHCTGREVIFKTGNTLHADTWTWNLGDGTMATGSEIFHIYKSAATYTVELMSGFDNGCTRKETKQWVVSASPTAAFDLADELPVGQPVELVSNSLPEGVACEWLTDDGGVYSGSPVRHTFTKPDLHTVRLSVRTAEGCTDTLIRQGEVLGIPVADFMLEVDSCAGDVKIINHSELTGTVCYWDFGNGQSESMEPNPPVQHYNPDWEDRKYTIRLRLENLSGTDALEKSFVIKSKIDPKFEIWPSQEPCIKEEKEIRILTHGEMDTTYIDWGDGTKDEWSGDVVVNALTHAYPENTGTSNLKYTITLRPVNACHRGAWTEEVTVVPRMREARIMEDESEAYKNKCFNNARAFWNKSYGYIPEGFLCRWNFGDGTDWQEFSSVTDSVVHFYKKPGDYIVRMEIKDVCETDTAFLHIHVAGNDSLMFEVEHLADGEKPFCSGDTLRLRFVQKGKEPFTDLRWTLPDGKEVGNVAEVLYPAIPAGEQVFRLSARAEGCPSYSEQQTLSVYQTPKPRITAADGDGVLSTGCAPLVLKLRAANLVDAQSADCFWDFGNGTSSSEEIPPKVVYGEEGKKTITLRLVSEEGCVAADSLHVTVLRTPDALLALSDTLVCASEGAYQLTAFNRTEQPEENSYEWRMNDETEVFSMRADTVVRNYKDFWGKEIIRLRAIDRMTGCADTVSAAFVLSRPIRAGLAVSPDVLCEDVEVVFRDTTREEGVYSRRLTFEDGMSTAEEVFYQSFPEPGRYPYIFVVRNAQGCTDTLTDTLSIHTVPVPLFEVLKDRAAVSVPGVEGALPEVENGGVRFINNSYLDALSWEPTGLEFRWDFGDSSPLSMEREPSHDYPNNGDYEVWLYAITEAGCCDSISNVVEISGVKGLFFPNALAPASADPGIARFQPKGIGLYSFEVKIYAQNGSCVWKSNALKDGKPSEYWDGTWNGQPVPAGVYLWEASAVFLDGSVEKSIKGKVIVIR